MLSTIFNRIFRSSYFLGGPGYGSVYGFPISYPPQPVPEKASIEMINACKNNDINRVRQMLELNPMLVHATQYFVPQGNGSLVVHSGDGIFCMTAVQASVLSGSNNILKLLVEGGAGVTRASIYSAAARGNIEAVKLMLTKNNHQGKTIFSNDIHTLNSALVSACANGHREIANFLLDNGASIEGDDDSVYYASGNPLEAAMNSRNLELVSDLIRRGADLNAHAVRRYEAYKDSYQEAIALVRSARLQGVTPQTNVSTAQSPFHRSP